MYGLLDYAINRVAGPHLRVRQRISAIETTHETTCTCFAFGIAGRGLSRNSESDTRLERIKRYRGNVRSHHHTSSVANARNTRPSEWHDTIIRIASEVLLNSEVTRYRYARKVYQPVHENRMCATPPGEMCVMGAAWSMRTTRWWWESYDKLGVILR